MGLPSRTRFSSSCESPPRSRGFLQGVAGAESSFVEVAVVEPGPGSDSGLDSLEI